MDHLKPRWWQLYLLGLFWIALLWLVHYWHASQTLHDMARVAITLCCYGTLNLWLSANSEALEHRETLKRDQAEGKAPAINMRQANYRQSVRRVSDRRRTSHDALNSTTR